MRLVESQVTEQLLISAFVPEVGQSPIQSRLRVLDTPGALFLPRRSIAEVHPPFIASLSVLYRRGS